VEHAVVNVLWLLQRQSELEALGRAKGPRRLADEQELQAIRSRLSRYSDVVKTVAAKELHRPIDTVLKTDSLRVEAKSPAIQTISIP
jgi:hypothetical protein